MQITLEQLLQEVKKAQEELDRKQEELKRGQEELKRGQEELKIAQGESKRIQEQVRTMTTDLWNLAQSTTVRNEIPPIRASRPRLSDQPPRFTLGYVHIF